MNKPAVFFFFFTINQNSRLRMDNPEWSSQQWSYFQQIFAKWCSSLSARWVSNLLRNAAVLWVFFFSLTPMFISTLPSHAQFQPSSKTLKLSLMKLRSRRIVRVSVCLNSNISLRLSGVCCHSEGTMQPISNEHAKFKDLPSRLCFNAGMFPNLLSCVWVCSFVSDVA